MQSLRLMVLYAFASTTCTQAVDENPLGKTLQLLGSLRAKVVVEGEQGDLAYREYVNWCDDSANTKRNEIKTATSKSQDLEAAIGKLTSAIASSTSTIEDLVSSIATQTKDLEDATVIRNSEAKEFAANEAELMDTIDTLGRAIAIISKEMAKNPAAFAQLDTSSFDKLTKSLGALLDAASLEGATKQKLVALVQASQGQSDSGEEDPSGAPAAAVYKSHSSDLLEVLEDMKEKAEEELASIRKAETNAKQNYSMLKQSLDDANKNDNKDMDDEKAAKKAAEEEKATAEKDLAMTQKSLTDANSVLSSMKTDCMQVAADHQTTVAGRNEELNTLDKAIKILKDTSTGAVEQTYSFVQVQSSLRTRADLKQAEVANLVQQLAKKFHSVALSQLASRINAVMRLGGSAGEDPFVKVKALIVDLIAKLEAEASAAAEEKTYCDDQMAKTEEKKSELEEDISALVGKIDKASAASTQLKSEVKELQAELAALFKMQTEMDKIRADENAAYTKAKKGLTLGLAGVRQAISVFRDYYGSNAEANAFVQDSQPAKPILFKKAEGAGGSIIGILQVVESDFAQQLAKEEQEESDSQSLYDKTTQENKVTQTMDEQSVKYKVQEFKGLDKSIADMSSEKATKDSQLKAVLDYYATVKDRCIAKPETYQQRKARREAEIAGLKEALSILENDTALMQLHSKRSSRSAFKLEAM